MRVVKVDWIDSMREGGWHSLDDVVKRFPHTADDLECVSIGFLVAEDDDRLMICRDVSGDQINDTITIPKVSVRYVKDIAA